MYLNFNFKFTKTKEVKSIKRDILIQLTILIQSNTQIQKFYTFIILQYKYTVFYIFIFIFFSIQYL